jgi:hypothetical protein
LTAQDEVAFPVAAPDTVQDQSRAVVDQYGRGEEPTAALIGAPAPLAQRPAGAQPSGQLPAQAALALVERLVNRLVADMPARPVGKRRAQVGGDLLRAPLQLQLGLHLRTQLGVFQQPRPARPARALPGTGMGQITVIATAVVG